MKQLKTGPMSEFQQFKERVRKSSKAAFYRVSHETIVLSDGVVIRL
jgi:hypothetical protein